MVRREGRETKTLRLVKRQAIAAKKEQEFHEKWKTCEGGASLMTQPPVGLGFYVIRFLRKKKEKMNQETEGLEKRTDIQKLLKTGFSIGSG